MRERKLAPRTAGRDDTGRPFLLWAWYTPMAVVGFGFGLIGERRPLGEGVLLHPLILFFVLTGVALLVLRDRTRDSLCLISGWSITFTGVVIG